MKSFMDLAAEQKKDMAQAYAYLAELRLRRAEAAEQRVAELEHLHSGRDACQLRSEIEDLRGGLEAAEAELAALRAALEAAVDFIATGDFREEARRQAIAKAERALKP